MFYRSGWLRCVVGICVVSILCSERIRFQVQLLRLSGLWCFRFMFCLTYGIILYIITHIHIHIYYYILYYYTYIYLFILYYTLLSFFLLLPCSVSSSVPFLFPSFLFCSCVRLMLFQVGNPFRVVEVCRFEVYGVRELFKV